MTIVGQFLQIEYQALSIALGLVLVYTFSRVWACLPWIHVSYWGLSAVRILLWIAVGRQPQNPPGQPASVYALSPPINEIWGLIWILRRINRGVQSVQGHALRFTHPHSSDTRTLTHPTLTRTPHSLHTYSHFHSSHNSIYIVSDLSLILLGSQACEEYAFWL